MSTRTLEEPSYTIRYLEELRNLFMFYHHSPDWLLEVGPAIDIHYLLHVPEM